VLTQSIDLRAELRGVLFPLAQFERVKVHLEEGAALAEEIGDQPRLGRITTLQAHYHCIIVGDMAPAIEHARRAAEIASAVGSPSLLGGARFVLGQVQHLSGDFRDAIETLETNIEKLHGDLENERAGFPLPMSLVSRVWLAFGLAEVGRFADALAFAKQAIDHAESLGHPYSLYHAHWSRVAVLLAKGEHAETRGPITRLRQIVEESVPSFIDNVTGLFAYASVLSGQPTEAISLLEEPLVRPPRNAFTRVRDTMYMGEACLCAGQLERALATAQRALAMAGTGQRGNEAHACRLMGDVQAARECAGAAEESYRSAMNLAVELGMRPVVAHCHLGLGKLYRRTGKREEAQDRLTTATTMYRDMAMSF
jgi:tetratricopeptide (TPR) repeat protein